MRFLLKPLAALRTASSYVGKEAPPHNNLLQRLCGFAEANRSICMSDEIIELRRRIEGLSDEELSIMLTAESDQYRPIALGYASSELKRRKLTLDEIGVRTLPEADRIYATQWNEYR